MLILILIFIATVFQVTISPFLNIWIAVPNFLIILCVFIGISQSFRNFLIFSLVAGIMFDIFSGLPFGFTAIIFLVFPIIINILFTNIIEELDLKNIFIVSFIFTLVYYLVLLILFKTGLFLRLIDWSPNFSFDFLKLIFFSSLYNGIIAGLIFTILNKTGVMGLRKS